MRPRTLILLILVIVVAAAAALYLFVLRPEGGLLGGGEETAAQPVVEQESGAETQEEPGTPPPTPTPQRQFEDVIVAIVDLPVGERIRPDLIQVVQRPAENVAVLAGVTFADSEEVVGELVRTFVGRGQEILRPMIALSPSDITAMGSDLSLYIEQGEVAVAFPIDKFTGAAYAMRPGDLVDALMTLQVIDVDEEFQTKLPNIEQRVNESALLEGQAFLFPPTQQGRLELIPNLNSVALIGPGGGKEASPRRVTQLTLQQMEVLWVGSWRDPADKMRQEFSADAITDLEKDQAQAILAQGSYPPDVRVRYERNPDAVILSMTAQNALALKWALEAGIHIDLVLRAQGDVTQFVTTSVTLPQLFEQGVLTAPPSSDVSLEPRVDEVPVPFLPANPPG